MRRKERIKEIDSPELTLLIQKLLQQGYKVGRIAVGNGLGGAVYSMKALRVNGKLCKISICRNLLTIDTCSFIRYDCTWTTLRQYQFLIGITNVDNEEIKYFVIPVSTIPQPKSHRLYIYIPKDGYKVNQHRRQKVDYTTFEDAWHLLKN